MKEGTMKKIKKRSNDKNQIHIQNNVIKKISKTYCRVLCYYFILKKANHKQDNSKSRRRI